MQFAPSQFVNCVAVRSGPAEFLSNAFATSKLDWHELTRRLPSVTSLQNRFGTAECDLTWLALSHHRLRATCWARSSCCLVWCAPPPLSLGCRPIGMCPTRRSLRALVANMLQHAQLSATEAWHDADCPAMQIVPLAWMMVLRKRAPAGFKSQRTA